MPADQAQRTNTGGLLYAIRAEGTSLVKIGYTTGSVEKRIKAMQTGQPFPLCVIATHPIEDDVRRKEAWLHAFLNQERRSGEWFDIALDQETFADLIARAIQFGAAQEAQRQEAHTQKALLKKQARMARRSTEETFGDRLARIRGYKRFSQQDIANVTGIRVQNISRFETDERCRVRSDTLIKLAIALECSADYLLGLTDDPTPARQRHDARQERFGD